MGDYYSGQLPSDVVVERLRATKREPDSGPQEALLLVLITLDLGLLLTLIPSLDKSLNPFWQTFIALAGGFAVGRKFLLDHVVALAGRRGTIKAAISLLPVMLLLNVLQRYPLVPLNIEPVDAIVKIDGSEAPLSRPFVVVGAHTVHVEPKPAWEGARKTAMGITPLESVRMLVGLYRPQLKLLCPAVVKLDAGDAGAVVTLTGRQPLSSAYFDVLPAAATQGRVRLQPQANGTLELRFEGGATDATFPLPVGRYAAIARRSECSTSRAVEANVVASDCAGSSSIRFGEICPS
jgi:hypothetical protein